MSELKFMVNGCEMTAAEIAASSVKKPARKSEALKAVSDRSSAKVSLGFVVVGYSTKHWEERVHDWRRDCLAFSQDPTKNKNPGTLDEYTHRWMVKNKPKRVRSKPYEIESASDACAELARKAGWLHVCVEELLKG